MYLWLCNKLAEPDKTRTSWIFDINSCYSYYDAFGQLVRLIRMKTQYLVFCLSWSWNRRSLSFQCWCEKFTTILIWTGSFLFQQHRNACWVVAGLQMLFFGRGGLYCQVLPGKCNLSKNIYFVGKTIWAQRMILKSEVWGQGCTRVVENQ